MEWKKSYVNWIKIDIDKQTNKQANKPASQQASALTQYWNSVIKRDASEWETRDRVREREALQMGPIKRHFHVWHVTSFWLEQQQQQQQQTHTQTHLEEIVQNRWWKCYNNCINCALQTIIITRCLPIDWKCISFSQLRLAYSRGSALISLSISLDLGNVQLEAASV